MLRDDVLGLAMFRQLPTTPRPQPTLVTPSAAPLASNFAALLRQVTQVRPIAPTPLPTPTSLARPATGTSLSRPTTAALQPLKPYVSPMARSAAEVQQQQQQQAAAARKALTSPNRGYLTPSQTTTTTSTTTTRAAAPTTVDRTPKPEAAPPVKETNPTQPDPSATAMALSSYPHPNNDNGRGMHWVPTTSQSPAVVDRFVAEAQRMGVKWVTFLNNGANVGDNDYLVNKLVSAGIEPVMRVYSPTLEPMQGDIEGMTRHFTALGVHYFQPFNEPNLNAENPDDKVSVDRYLDAWIPAAQAIVRGGGLPGFGSMAPGGDYDDQQFLTAALDGLKKRGQLGMLDRSWLSMHNYTWNHPIADRGDGDGFFKFRAYNKIVRQAIGRDLPILGTEGGSIVGEQEDAKMAPVSAAMATDWTSQAFKYMRDQREPWLFTSSVWTIASLAGGGSDSRFEAQSLFHADGSQSGIVSALQAMG
jgi:hypothetical protein